MKVLLVGYLPPPYNGMSSATIPLLGIPNVVLLNLSGSATRRSGKWGRGNLNDAVRAAVGLLSLRPWRFRMAHVPIAQNTSGLLRDFVLLFILLTFRIPYVVHLHGGYLDQYIEAAPRVMRILARRLVGRAIAGVVLTESLKRCLLAVLPEDRLHVIGNGCSPALLGRARTPHEGFTVLHLTTLSEEKGTCVLLQAAARLPEIKFLLAGPGHEQARKWAVGLGNVSVEPPVADEAKASLFALADCFALPTMYRYEGQPIVILEAMSAGLPVIATARAGIPETLAGARFVAEGDVGAFEEAVRELASRPQEASRMGENNLRRWGEHYTKEHYVDAVTALWKMLQPRA